MRTLVAIFGAAWSVLAWAACAGAQTKVNNALAEKIRSTGAGFYVLPATVVILAAILMAASMLRRTRR